MMHMRIAHHLATEKSRGPKRLAMLIAVASLALPAALMLATPARANGVPTFVDLAYIEGLSNWGPTDATGTLELSFGEGFARLDASGLPALSGQTYQGWIVNSETNDAISIGAFNADTSDVVSYQGALPVITDFGFDLFIITVEPEPDDAPQPTVERSIGGRFTLLGDVPSDGGTPGDAQQTAPGELPNTGDPTLRTDLFRIGLLLTAIGLSIFVGMRVGRSRA